LNDSLLVIGQLIAGLILLVGGGELLVRGASAMAATFRVSPLVIGLTVVAFGTSAPELGVSLQAALSNNADIAVGNVIGSNIINILLILGVSALVTPLVVNSQLIRIDVPLMIAASLAMWAVAADGVITRWEGVLLFIALLIYIVFCIAKSRSETKAVIDEFAQEYSKPAIGWVAIVEQITLIIGGLILLGWGSNWLVDGSVIIATKLGVDELLIGLTIVSIGTSLPEVVTSVVASYRGERDIAVGNVVGSNLFNILCVLGLTSAISPTGINVLEEAIIFDIPIMVAVAILCFPIFLSGNVIRRHEAALFLVYYGSYTAFLIAASTRPELKESFGKVALYGVLPLTAFALFISLLKHRHRTKDPDPLPQETDAPDQSEDTLLIATIPDYSPPAGRDKNAGQDK
jgi:cation:H+ antiporter